MSTLTLKKDVPVANQEPAQPVPDASEDSDLVPIRIDLGDSASHISFNGQPYYHGRIYNVTVALARQLQETCVRTKAHEASLHGNENMGRRPRPQYA